MIRFLFTITLLYFCSIFELFSQQPEISPLNPDYVEYLKNKEKNLRKISDPDNRFWGYIPEPILPNTNNDPAYKKPSADLPEFYDWRTLGKVSSVKNQKNCGSCWAFATMAVLESRLMILGYGEMDLSENNLKECNGFVKAGCDGGNVDKSMAYFSRNQGPIEEIYDTYIDSATGCRGYKTPSMYVKESLCLPADISSIKQAILDYGPVATAFYWSDSFYYAPTFTYYYPNQFKPTNHIVTIVGWDDSKATLGGFGAWIAKNSWGTNFGEKGYFYISYNDTRVNLHCRSMPNIIDDHPDRILYYYDKLGWLSAIGSWNSGLVKFTASSNQKITKLATYLRNASSTVDFDLYSSFDGTTLTDQIGSLKNQTRLYAGYYTFDLPNPVLIRKGKSFYIKVKYKSNAAGASYLVPIERVITDYASPSIESGKCWLSNDGSPSWRALGANTSYPYDLCIKAYAIPDNSIPETFKLHQNYPNPFNPETNINFDLPKSGLVTIKIYNTLGQEVQKPVDKKYEAGNYTITWKPVNQPSGVYFYQLRTGNYNEVKKMVYLR